MADLLDIAPSTSCEVVKINDTRIIVRGLRADAVGSIIARFPTMIGLLLGGMTVADFVPRFFQQFGAAAGPVIAAGCGHLENEKYEQFAAKALLLEDQLRLVFAIIQLTCPNGFGFFAELMAKLNRATGEEAKVYTVRKRKSPSLSQPSSEEASRQNLQ